MKFLRRVVGIVTLIGVAVGATVVLRRRLSRPHERVDLYYADGSMASFEAGEPEAERFLALGRDGLQAARTL